jgi:hypothetical protein
MTQAGEFYKDGEFIKQEVTKPTWTIDAFTDELEANKIRLKEALERSASIPVKTEHDLETFIFWQFANERERQQAQDEVDRLTAMIAKMEAIMAAAETK